MNKPINYTTKTRQVTAAEEQTYLQIAENHSTETVEQKATIQTATNSKESIPDSEKQFVPQETSAETTKQHTNH